MSAMSDEPVAALSPARLDAAVARGILSREQADHLADFWVRQERIEDQQAPVTRVDAEEVRFARGFHDIFIAIGIVILLVGMMFGLRDTFDTWIVAGFGAAVVWVLSEIFAKRMRLALPSFLLSLAFAPFFFVTCVGFFVDGDASIVAGGLTETDAWARGDALIFALPTVIAMAGAALHYVRFKVPVGMTGIVACGLLLAAFLIESAVPNLVSDNIVWFTLLAGLVSFGLAMMFDSRDPQRVTLNSDKAFWLHLMAAPLIVHSVLTLTTGDADFQSTSYAVVVIALFLFLAFAAMLVDRRALLVSGLGYFGFAIASLMMKAEVSEEVTFAMTLVLLGCFILLLGSAWRRVRRLVVRPFASTAIMNFVPAID
ncbi:hypothetical protein [Roseibium sp.]|uniref:hypothetical protein n=1 Tax=Roseibium sp. TaxID=1936156 RepID=UPI003A97ACD8